MTAPAGGRRSSAKGLQHDTHHRARLARRPGAGCLFVADPGADAASRPRRWWCPNRRSSRRRPRSTRRPRSGADISTLPANEQQALAKLVQAGWMMDALFLRQVWAGNEGLLLNLLDRPIAARPGPAALLPDQQGAVGSRSITTSRSSPGVPAKPEGANFYPAGRDQGRDRGVDEDAARGAARAGDRLLHDHPPRRRQRQRLRQSCPTASSTRASWRARPTLLREAAALTAQPTLKAFLDSARRRVPQQRLLRERRGVDGARREHRADHRPLRGLRGRVVQRQGRRSKRSSPCATTRRPRSWRSSAPSCRASRTTCRSTRRSATRSSAALAPIRVVNVVLAAGDGNRGVQTAAYNLPNDERVVREKGAKRVMLKNVQEAKFNLVLDADRGEGARRRRSRRTSRSTRSSRTS